ncbi:pyruvate:ferredoxin (flavodoxin) oxidoreductase, partial [Nostoc sp. CCCryo 231-06]|nr:pyruvate:ferredoxin (flavodoxin) oxidoreductase [Nostoc sp. CCCryo 231-06]
DRPVLRGTAQNPDVYFQGREGANPYYNACPEIVQRIMDEFGERTGRHYKIYEYYGAKDASRVIVLMGSGCETVHETVDYLNARGEKLGVVKVRLYRPFDVQKFVAVLPTSVQAIAVLDRTKEAGSAGEPLYLDVVAAIHEAWGDKRAGEHTSTALSNQGAGSRGEDLLPRPLPPAPLPKIIGGRYGLSSKEFTPPMVKGIFDNLAQPKPKNHFTVGINDDVSHTSLSFDPNFSTESDNVVRAMFYGLGADG